ncbi:LppA family lipoprotein [Occultella glacieicola]|nr:LppA family lipoprotein [Occultella glacieicola]
MDRNAQSSSTAPSMEQVLTDYAAMRDEMTSALARALGERAWRESPNSPGPRRSRIGGADPAAEQVGLVTWSFEGTYPADTWHGAARLVAEVGRAYGFTDGGVTVDRPGDLEIFGVDALGGRYTFGMATNTILTLRTGPLRWEHPPEPAGPQT